MLMCPFCCHILLSFVTNSLCPQGTPQIFMKPLRGLHGYPVWDRCPFDKDVSFSIIFVLCVFFSQNLGDLRILDALVACISGPYRELADITFNFWYRLSEVIYKKDVRIINEHFRPYVQRLVQALCVHCQMESDHVSHFCDLKREDGFIYLGVFLCKEQNWVPVFICGHYQAW